MECQWTNAWPALHNSNQANKQLVKTNGMQDIALFSEECSPCMWKHPALRIYLQTQSREVKLCIEKCCPILQIYSNFIPRVSMSSLLDPKGCQ